MTAHEFFSHVHKKFLDAQRQAKKALQRDLRDKTKKHARAHVNRMHAYKQVSLGQFKELVESNGYSYEKLASLTPNKKREAARREEELARLEERLRELLDSPGEVAVNENGKTLVKKDALALAKKIGKKKGALDSLIKK